FMNFDTGMDITNTGSITIASTDEDPPNNLNGPRDQLRIRNFGGPAHYVIDIQGYHRATRAGSDAISSAASEPTGYEPMVPCRIADTRLAGGRLTDREIRDLRVTDN